MGMDEFCEGYEQSIQEQIACLKEFCIKELPELEGVKNPFNLNHTDEQILNRLKVLKSILNGDALQLQELMNIFSTSDSYLEWVFEQFFGRPFIGFLLITKNPSEQTESYVLNALNIYMCNWDLALENGQFKDAVYLFEFINISDLNKKGKD